MLIWHHCSGHGTQEGVSWSPDEKWSALKLISNAARSTVPVIILLVLSVTWLYWYSVHPVRMCHWYHTQWFLPMSHVVGLLWPDSELTISSWVETCRNFWNPALLNTLRRRQNGCHVADDIFKHILLNENCTNSIKISLKFLIVYQYWFRWWLGAEFSAANLALAGFSLTNALGENLPSRH